MANMIPPQPVGVIPGSFFWNDWIEKLRQLVNSTSSTALTPAQLADLTDGGGTTLHTHAHNNLQTIQGGAAGDYFHLTGAQQTDLTDGGDSALHFHSSDRNSANFTGTSWVDLTDGGDSTLHFHAADRARANHTGTQTMSTISDLPVLASGTYTPTLTAVSNIAASTTHKGHYTRMGNIVTVSGHIDVDPTANGVATNIGISLPIASNLAVVDDLSGAATTGGSSLDGMSGQIDADTANDRANLLFVPTNNPNSAWYFTFMYEVI